MPLTPIPSGHGAGGNTSAQTAAVGTNWTAFAAQPCAQMVISNNTGTTIEFRQGGAGVGFPIPTGQMFTISGISDTSQISVRRVDTTNTQVTVAARWHQ